MDNLAAKIIEEYNFAKGNGLDSIVIVIETESGTYNVSEYFADGELQGFISDSFDFLYGDIEEIAEDLAGIINGEVLDIRIE